MAISKPLPDLIEEDDLCQECKEILPSLTREKGWFSSHYYRYQGFWLTHTHLQGILRCRTHFQAQNTDIFLVTLPKSGTTWLKALIFTLVNRKTHPVGKDHPLLSTNPHLLVPFLEDMYILNPVPDLSSSSSNRLFGSHLPVGLLPESVRESGCKIVYLCRNLKDTFLSLWHFTNGLRPPHLGANPVEDCLDRFCRGVSAYGPFWDHILGYWQESLERAQKLLFLKYEEIKDEPDFHLTRLAEFLGCPFSQEEEIFGVGQEILRLCSFDNMRNLDVNQKEENKVFFRKGEVGDWKNYLTAEMGDRIDRMSDDKFSSSGLKL